MTLKKRADETVTETPPLEQKPTSRRKSQESVIVYITLLFTIVFLLVLLSYFMHQRESENTISSLTEEHSEFQTQAQANIAALQTRNIELSEGLEVANSRIAELQTAITEAERAAEEAGLEKDELQKQYDELIKSRTAVERLLELELALRDGEDEAINTALTGMEEYAEYLDGAFTELFEDMKEHPESYMPATEVPEEQTAEEEVENND